MGGGPGRPEGAPPPMSERARIAAKQRAGSVGALLDHTPPRPLRDHRRDNVRSLRELERHVRERKAKEQAAQASPSFTLRQFANVPPRVYREAPTPTPSRPRARSVPHVRGGTPNPPSPFRCSPWALSPGRWGEDAPAPPSPPVPAAAPAARALRFSPAPRGGALATPAGSVQTPVRSRQIVDWGSSTKEAKENVAPRGNTLPMAEAGRNLQSLFDAERGSEDIAGGDPEHCAAICPAEFERAAEEVERRRGQRPATEAGALGGAEWGGTPARRDDDILGSAVAIPPGFRLVPDEERRETLGELRQRMRELDERYARLPLKIETEGQRQLQRSLREKIAETENAMRLFSRSSVLMEI
mmetsp:Transcript_77420/g.205542  ORF Transcript_77420/g.205542 Transcript_77420/m.205542 type:complete len:357 (-) Transcript_77420:37-1107(-)